MLSLADADLVDLSIGLEPGAHSEPWPPEVEYFDHADGAELLAGNLQELGHDVDAEDFPDGMGLAWEEVTAIPHTGTHVDAPWHYGPESGDEPAMTIDEVPLDWCRGNAVVLDFRDLEPGADEHWGEGSYLTEFPGMGAAATKHLVEQGVRVIGTDAYGFDKPFAEMGRRYADAGDDGELWPAHFAGRDVPYLQIEKMANLDRLPRRTEVPVVCFPVTIADASAGWVRPVAMFEPGTLPDGGDPLATDGGPSVTTGDDAGAATGGDPA